MFLNFWVSKDPGGGGVDWDLLEGYMNMTGNQEDHMNFVINI